MYIENEEWQHGCEAANSFQSIWRCYTCWDELPVCFKRILQYRGTSSRHPACLLLQIFCLFIFIFLLFCFSIFIATAVFCRLLHPAPKPQLCFTALKDESNKYLRCHVTPLKNRPGLLQFQYGSWRVFPALLNAWRRTGREPCVLLRPMFH